MKKDKAFHATVLITGASGGIGLELAREFARHGHPLVIVAPQAAELVGVAQRLQQEFRVAVLPLAEDLTEAGAAEGIFAQLQDDGVPVDILVNNAACGQRGKFWEIPLERDLEMIRLNVEAVIRLTKFFLPSLLARGRGWILNTAPVAGGEPGSSPAVDRATRAFVLSWSEALAAELDGTGITVTAFCPGPVDTDFFPEADRAEARAFQQAKALAPEDIAPVAYTALFRGERVVTPGAMNKAMILGRHLVPEPARANGKFHEDVDPDDHRREPGGIAMRAGVREN